MADTKQYPLPDIPLFEITEENSSEEIPTLYEAKQSLPLENHTIAKFVKEIEQLKLKITASEKKEKQQTLKKQSQQGQTMTVAADSTELIYEAVQELILQEDGKAGDRYDR